MLTSACQGCSYGDAVAVHGQDGCVHTYTEGCAREGCVCIHAHCTLCVHVCVCTRAVVSVVLWVYTLWRAALGRAVC